MVQIIQSQPTQRQSALEQALGQAVQGFGASYMQGQQTLRQQALADQQMNLKLAEMGIDANAQDLRDYATGTYKPKVIEAGKDAVPAQYKDLQGPVQPGKQLGKMETAPAQEAVAPVYGNANPMMNFTAQRKAQIEREKKKAEQEDKLANAKIKDLEVGTEKKQSDINFDNTYKGKLISSEIDRNLASAAKSKQEKSISPNKDIDSIRKEINGLPVTKDMMNIDAALGKVMSAKDTAAGDMSLIYGFMKIQDPGSTVREGEFATAQNAGSIPERVRAAYNKALSGERLTGNQRNDFKRSASELGRAQYQTFKSFIEPHMKSIQERGLDQSQIIPGFSQSGIYNGNDTSIAQVSVPAPGADAGFEAWKKAKGFSK